MSDAIVSFDSEKLILVDDNDNEIGYKSKAECHQGEGLLHRAFSIFIFNKNRELILQQRSGQKLLWPEYWANSCCSHPRQGERIESAASRRLSQELGITTDLKYLYKFKYNATFGDSGSENELCSVFIGYSNSEPVVNSNEIMNLKYIPIQTIAGELETNPDIYSPWFKMEWERITADFFEVVEKLFAREV